MKPFFIVILLFLSASGFAQHSIAHDSGNVTVRSFNKAAMEKYKKDEAFNYEKVVEPANSLWIRFWRWFWYKVDQILSTPAGRNTFWSILILIIVAAVLFIVLKMNSDRTGLFKRGNKGLDYQVGEENIHDISFEDAIRQAVEQENYRLAVRLVYLHSLKLLSDKILIDWKPGKTNTAYLYELKEHSSFSLFAQLTQQFEFAWYGGETVNKEDYREFDSLFNDFKIKIA